MKPHLSDSLQAILNKHAFEIKEDKSSAKKAVIFVKSTDRNSTQIAIEKELHNKGFSYHQEKISALSGSTDCTVIDYNSVVAGAKVILAFKPLAGGMQETTLNSTITELAPALAFSYGKKPKNVKEFYDFLKTVDHSKAPVYVVPANREAGKTFVDSFPSSSKFEEKMENALGILDYLYEENSKKAIKTVFWGYRQKPTGIDSAHKGDLFVEYKDNTMLGVSLKAGGERTSEPKFNTYVNKIMETISTSSNIIALRKALFKHVYSMIGIDDEANYDKSKKRETIKKLELLEKNNVKRYDEMYDIGLNIIRNSLIDLFNKDKKVTVNWIKSAILGDDAAVPLVVVKAFSNKYQILTDDNDIGYFLPKVTSVNSYASTSSKQDFFIDLKSKTETLTMKFAVRTNKSGSEHKLGQFYNLAVKFNGIKK